MTAPLKVITWVAIRDTCEMTATLHPTEDQIDFLIGPTTDAFEFGFDRPSLRRFIDLAQTSLARLDAGQASSSAQSSAAQG
ncbi:hypothetical protein [Actinokineospora cianjurensis]|uniref:Uncharacterized protein n=1 Tax=Actinokineospora cianjurensis TaxID=585224 RepID=A0A421B7V8_9PSEU|nr:hypothetical protein [Actinokineospora cianjurensis]RLK60409.1 hypothetical protein CLV68_0913 [Actinokineospora cianjurensis]